MDREKNLLQLRPPLPNIDLEKSLNPSEQFQNDCLRPILKQQNDLLLSIFQHYINQRKTAFDSLSLVKQKAFIAQSLQKDQRFRQFLIGTIVAWFTLAEWKRYEMDQKELNKRLITMLIKRLESSFTISH